MSPNVLYFYVKNKYIVSKPPCSPCLRVRSIPKIYFKTACAQACIAIPKATETLSEAFTP